MNKFRKNYKDLIDNIFGKYVCNIDVTINDKNNVIGALASAQFKQFTLSFESRLERISKIYKAHSHFRGPIQQAINQIADKNNWDELTQS